MNRKKEERRRQKGGKKGIEEVGWKKVIRERSKAGRQIVLQAAQGSR